MDTSDLFSHLDSQTDAPLNNHSQEPTQAPVFSNRQGEPSDPRSS